MKLSIIIPTKDRIEILNRTVENLVEAIKDVDAEIIIINDSKNPLSLSINSNKKQIINNHKSGAASARNYGVKKTLGQILLF